MESEKIYRWASGRVGFCLAFCWLSLATAESVAHDKQTKVIFSYWDQAAPPFVFLKNDQISGGIIKDIGDAISDRLKLKASYSRLPVARAEHYLREGKVDVTCVTSPIWKENPDQYFWSKPLFEGADRFLVKKGSKEIKSFDDLTGLRVGVYNGYTYHPDIMRMMKENRFEAVKLSDVEKGIMLVRLGRIDTFIDFGVLLKYQIAHKNLYDELELAEKHADDFTLSCAFSKKSKVGADHINSAVDAMLAEGDVDRILAKYR